MKRKTPRPHTADQDSSLLIQPDLGGGQRPREADDRPRGTVPVSAFAGPLGNGHPDFPGTVEPIPVRPGEAEAACEDGFPGDDAVRFSDAIEAGVFPGEGQRGPLYEGPERRKHQADWDVWSREDRRDTPFEYAGDQEV